MASDRRVRGFTLLEAVVALAILAAAGLALFAAMSQSIQMLGRAERAREIDGAMRNVLAVVEGINPMQAPHGEQRIGAFELRWRAEAIEPPRDNATGYLQPGLYEVGLYRLHLQLWRSGVLEHEAQVRRAGYRQVREPAAL
jgi:general secretion pathway protein I